MNTVKHGIGWWREDEGPRLRLVVTLELRTGDMTGDLSERGFKTVEHEPCPPGVLTLSVTHEVCDTSKKRSSPSFFVGGGFGVPREYVEALTNFDDGWDRAKLERLAEIGERWHLNSMQAGCAHMELPADPSYDARKGVRCPETGYKYGSAWLVEILPDELTTELSEVYGLTWQDDKS